MSNDGFKKLYWGFLFILIDFRLQGIDILPDIIGFIYFSSGIKLLMNQSIFFDKALPYNTASTLLSILSIYEVPINGGGVNIGFLGPIGILVGIVSTILMLKAIYYIFMGIEEIGKNFQKPDIYDEADKRWVQILNLQIAGLLCYVLIAIPYLAAIFIIALLFLNIIYTVAVMRFMNNCNKIQL